MSYGFVFNDQHSSQFGIVMESVDRTILPAKRRTKYIIPGVDGTYNHPQADYEAREIVIHVTIEGEKYTLESLRARIRTIAKWLSVNDALLIFDDEPDKAYKASIDAGVSLESLLDIGESDLVFTCQPFAESIQYLTRVKDVTENNSTLSIPVEGTQDAPCIITIKNTGTEDVTGITIQRKAEVKI